MMTRDRAARDPAGGGRHGRPVKEKRFAAPGTPASRGRRARYGYADTPGWIVLVESGRGTFDAIGVLAALWVGLRSIARWFGGLGRR